MIVKMTAQMVKLDMVIPMIMKGKKAFVKEILNHWNLLVKYVHEFIIIHINFHHFVDILHQYLLCYGVYYVQLFQVYFVCGLMGALQVDNPSFLLNYAYMSGGISMSMEQDKNAF